MPGGSLAGATLEFYQELDESSSSHRWAFRRYEIEGPSGTFSESWLDANDTSWNGAPFMELNYSLTGGGSNFFTEILGWTVYRGFMILSFDEDRNVVAWRGDNYNSDVGLDPRISNEWGDGWLGYSNRNPGTWTREVGPSPIPLPAGGALLAGG